MTYGMPYKGSKSRIAEAIISRLPPAKHFYDVFGGGGDVALRGPVRQVSDHPLQ